MTVSGVIHIYKSDWNNALIYMYDAADSHRSLLDSEYIDWLKELRDTTEATKANKNKRLARRALLKMYVEENGNPPPTKERKVRTNWVRSIAIKLSSSNSNVTESMIRADLKSAGL